MEVKMNNFTLQTTMLVASSSMMMASSAAMLASNAKKEEKKEEVKPTLKNKNPFKLFSKLFKKKEKDSEEIEMEQCAIITALKNGYKI